MPQTAETRAVPSPDQQVAAAAALLREVARDHHPAVFACSFSAEDCVLLDLVTRHAPAIEVVSLDTGRLPQETHDLMAAYAAHHGARVRLFFPDAAELAALVAEQGTNGFRASISARQACCQVRKVRPLERALAGKRAWVTGLRRAQSESRSGVALAELDAARGIYKFNPLAQWSDANVEDYLQRHGLARHALYARGYTSIGCAPCTRAVTAGEDVRAGRWWWENGVKECGLHVAAGRVERAGVTP